MQHLILTRMSYQPSDRQDAAFIRRRWELTKAVCAASLAGQTNTRFSWLVKVSRNDPLLSEKFQHMKSLPFPVFPFCEGGWGEAVGCRLRASGSQATGCQPESPSARQPVSLILTTRLDDDDALAVDAVERLQQRAEREAGNSEFRTTNSALVLALPHGYRSFDGKLSRVWQINNQFASLLSGYGRQATDYGREASSRCLKPVARSLPPTVMDVKHGQIGRLGRVVKVDGKIGWLWVRHRDAKSAGGMIYRGREPNTDHRLRFSIDWDRMDIVSAIEK